MLLRKCIPAKACAKKEERSQVSNLNFHLETQGKKKRKQNLKQAEERKQQKVEWKLVMCPRVTLRNILGLHQDPGKKPHAEYYSSS